MNKKVRHTGVLFSWDSYKYNFKDVQKFRKAKLKLTPLVWMNACNMHMKGITTTRVRVASY